ncbi:ABC transporter ATP-binding protein [Jannaschia seohaensis]|uniref:Peptide/nickel transport system ATP-binding protein n=1 Tax=Jannaschia seohaensis TaxID=475081 RepID=A0A2Y9B5I2_9RHOB|nr:oligopeptide/dipeptide ABC transporter ATP-binding protein [Jannaschia seohaensis]PWJ10051.1 peptide/nickel transport system ATP-binding protein [Jannaschia seohaensis]SSA51806.1 peptide/nickel transport system ATP-binding protein [Jannaschia seohaensis]
MSDPILTVKGVTRRFGDGGDIVARALVRLGLIRRRPIVTAVDNVSFTLERGKALGIVGESGCGKSTLGRMIAGLLPPSEGEITLDLGGKSSRALPMQMVFQDPFSSLNPRKRVRELVGEAPRVHRVVAPSELETYIERLMERCGIDPSVRDRFAHQFSGGQRQRIGIARALAVEPEILVADEAVSALDVSVQAQIINLFMDLRDEFGLTYVFISHDLGVVEHIADTVLVMYLGRVVEMGPAEDVFARPLHPYTRALIAGVPRLDRRRVTYAPIAGDIPSPIDPPTGCHFHPRCPFARDVCRVERPETREMEGRTVACHFAEDIATAEEPPAWPATPTA